MRRLGGGPVGNVVTKGGLKEADLPILPAAKKVMESRKEEEDPHYFCMPMGSRPWTVTFMARLQAPGDELMEYICQENNQYGIAGGHPNPFARP